MGKYVLTGGATGIGAAIKRQLLGQGHDIVVIDLKDGDYLADLGDPAVRKAVIDQVKADHPSIDGLITCAGVASQFPNPAKILQINYFGTVEIIEGLSENIVSGGRVVAISSNSAPMSTRPDLTDACLAVMRAPLSAWPVTFMAMSVTPAVRALWLGICDEKPPNLRDKVSPSTP